MLYNFTCNNYGENWFVAATSREQAIKAVRRAIQENYDIAVARATAEGIKYNQAPNLTYAESARESELRHLQACIDGTPHYEGGSACSIDEYPDGHVIFAEVA
jgi:16S rRNA G527 N7-methylase RsmG